MKKSFITIIIAGLLWGTSGLFVHYLAPYGFTTGQMTAVRGLVAVLVMVSYTVITERSAFRARPLDFLVYIGCGLMLYSTAVLYYNSIQLTSVATAAILMYTAPIFVTVYSVSLLGEKMTGLKLASIVMMLVGCALVSGIVGGFKADLVGILFGLGSGVCYAAYNIISKIGMKRGCSAKSTSVYGFIFMALAALPASDPVGIVERATDPLAWVLLLSLGAVTFVVPYFLYNTALKRLDAGTASTLGVIEPMSATVYAMIFLGQIPDVFAAFGIVLILAAVVLLGRSETGARADTEDAAQ